jgi:hypothetical protein
MFIYFVGLLLSKAKQGEGVLKNSSNGMHKKTANRVLTSRTLEVKPKQVRIFSMFPLVYLMCPLLFLFRSFEISRLSKSYGHVSELSMKVIASQKEEEGVHKNSRNERHQESTKPNICT